MVDCMQSLWESVCYFALEQRGMSAEVIQSAFLATEEAFLSIVTKAWPSKPQLASVGSCCLVGLIHERTLYVANLGDSRVVMGRLIRATGEIAAVQLSVEHNASMEAVRQELQSLHPDDSEIVVLKHDVWRVKGIIQEATICLDDVIGYGTNLIMTSTLGCVGLSQDTVSASVGFFGAAFYDFLAHLYTALHALGRSSFGNPVEYHRDVGSITVELLEQFYGFSVQDYK